ncbi:MAG: sulfatase [Planctomycetia bacterium]
MLAASLLLLAGCGSEPPAAPPEEPYDASGRPARPLPALPRRPNVIVLVIDTLRADAVDVQPGEPQGMPWLSRHARASTCFTQASASAPWTLPSMASLLTGLLPDGHGVVGEDMPPNAMQRATTWADVMAQALGYHTAALFGGLAPGVAADLGHGFARVEDGFTLAAAERWLDTFEAGRPKGAPFFLLLHTYEAHDPYGPAARAPGATDAAALERALAALDALPPGTHVRERVRRSVTDAAQRLVLRQHPRHRLHQADMTRYLWDGLATDPDRAAAEGLARELEQAYRRGLSWVDGLLEQAVASLRRRGLLDDTLLVITADHGEAFGEHGMLLHGRSLHDEVVRVPLVLQGPAPFDTPRVVEGSAGLRDLFPSVLAWLGAPLPRVLEGRSLLPLLGPRVEASLSAGLPVEAQEVRTHMHTGGRSQAIVGSVRDSHWKYIGTYDATAGTLREQAFDLRSDPEERQDRAGADGLVGDLPFTPAFCRAVERARDRLWAGAAQAAWSAAQGYSSGQSSVQVPRPAATCEPAATPR